MPKSRKDGFDVKVHVTRDHLGAFDLIKGANNRSKLIMHLVALGLNSYLGRENGAPIRTPPQRQENDQSETPSVEVDFLGDDQGF